ncbi:MAG: hypothetical protein U0165_11435 [Polyangiaceae bacterium]
MSRRSNRGALGFLTIATLFSLSLAACSSGDDAKPARVVSLTVVKADKSTSPATQLAVQACAGLYNRRDGGSVFVNLDDHDPIWIDELALKVNKTVEQADFLTQCVADFPSCVSYDYKTQQELLPNILTVGAVLGAVPIDSAMTLSCKSVAFDAKTELADKTTRLLATQYVYEKYGSQTTGLAMLTPGYEEQPKDQANPVITSDMQPVLVDFVYSQKLFVSYLVNGCISGDPESELLSTMVNAGNWPLPLGVYGYNSSYYALGGFLYEAQTLCLESRNMGAIASRTGNLSYYSTAKPAITEPGVVQQNPLESIEYDPTRTYVAFLVGDGDNIGYITSTRHDWFKQRLASCESGDCPVLTWTISPHLARIAPDLLRWYYDQSHKTKKDYFALPPSGHLYAYPSSLAEEVQGQYVAETEDDARILGISGVVHWDWLDTWHEAEDYFLPKYATKNGSIRGIFPVNVPYMASTFGWWPKDQYYEVLTGADGGHSVLFRPREWRGINNDDDVFFLSPQKMADEIANYPKGTVSWVYMTSDGGLTLDNAFMPMTKLLPDHVQLVSADTAAKLALAAKGN